MVWDTTRRVLLGAAASWPELALFGREPDGWKARCRNYLGIASQVKAQPARALHAEIAKLAIGDPIAPAVFDAILEFLAARRDLVDFATAGMIRILYLYGNGPRIPDGLKRRMKEAVLDFRPWLYPQDPPVKTVSVYWTENHQALYSSILSGLKMCPFREMM